MPRQRPRGGRQKIPGPSFNASGNWQDRGFESQGAAQSVGKQYGLMKQPGGGWGKPTMGQFSGMMETAGYGPKFQARSTNEAGTPVEVGGAPWMMGKNGLDFTGQAANDGGAYQVNQGGGGGRQRAANFQSGTGRVGQGGQQGMPHNQIGQKGKGGGQQRPRPGGGGNGPGGQQLGFGGPATPGAAQSGGAGSVGQFPTLPPAPPNFLPNTPGFEQAQGQANDQLAAAEGQYAQGKTMIGAQLGLQGARLNTDQDVATSRQREDLAGRGIFTPYGAGSTMAKPQMATSPGGGGVGESLYNRNVATPFGRQRQDLGAAGAGAYGDLSQQYGQAQLRNSQDMYQAYLQRANDAYGAMPLSAQMGEYDVPDMANPIFSGAPGGGGGGGRPGRTRPRKNKPKGKGKGKGKGR
jgi:hypothetical protein